MKKGACEICGDASCKEMMNFRTEMLKDGREVCTVCLEYHELWGEVINTPTPKIVAGDVEVSSGNLKYKPFVVLARC